RVPHGGPFSGLAAARYHTVAPERRCASQQKLRADVADGVKRVTSCALDARGMSAMLTNVALCHIRTFAPAMFSRCSGSDTRINQPGKRAEPVLKIPSAVGSRLAQTPDRHQHTHP